MRDEHGLQKALERLEFQSFCDIIGEHLATPAGRVVLCRLGPLSPDEARQELALLERAISLLDAGANPPMSDVPDAGKALEKARLGSLLSGTEFLELSDLVMAGAKIFDALEELGIVPDPYYLVPLAQEIRRTFGPDGEIVDGATPELRRIRDNKRKQRVRVVSLMEKLASASREDLRDEGVTIRNGRFVLPFASHVKTEGVVHGYSRTTETQYVEPLESVEEQNRLVRLAEEEAEEIKRILSELSGRAHGNAGFLAELWDAVGRADLVWAKAKYASEVGACIPQVMSEKGIVLHGACHPVLLKIKGQAETVPLDLRTGPYVVALVFTGPNAGGKTVALKTVALALLATASGLPFPAKEVRAWVPENFFALGFEESQSIETGVSSFTGLLAEIKYLLSVADSDTVAFFDEVLSSTDPSEGGALAFAILKRLADMGARTFSTTHLTVLKNMASSQEGFLGAAAELDRDGNPTFHFKIGSIGQSYALSAARRVGFPEDVLVSAEAALEGYQEEMVRLRQSLAEKESELAGLIAEHQGFEKELAAREKQAMDAARAEARRIVAEARKEVEKMLDSIRNEASSEKKLAKARKVRKELRQEEVALDRLFSRKATEPEPGKNYRVSPLGFVGELIELRGDKALLSVGKARVEVETEALYEV